MLTTVAFTVLGALTWPSCSRREASESQVERPAPSRADDPQGVASDTGTNRLEMSNSTPQETILYAAPEGWSPVEGSGLQKASFQIAEGTLVAEVTAMCLPGSLTKLLPNVNLWRRQIGLKDISQEELDAVLKALEIGGRSGHYIQLVGPSEAERPQGMLVVLTSGQDHSWLLRMSGDVELVLRHKERFEEFVKSVKFVRAGGE